MKLHRTQAVMDYKLLTRFEKLRQQLESEFSAERLDTPLAFWTVPNDRRLPLAFMARTIRELIATPFEELYSTPGVGQKKIAAMIDLLGRVAQKQQEFDPSQPDSVSESVNGAGEPITDDGRIIASQVSESTWKQWRETVRRHGLEREQLGRFARSLQDLPRVVWQTPLETYIDLSLTEIRALKTHGEKRVRVVVEIFGWLHRQLERGQPVSHLAVRILPRFILPIEAWLLAVETREVLPDNTEIKEQFVEPLVRQTFIDAGEHIGQLVEERLGLRGNGSSVKQAAKRLGITRARVYQLLNEVGDIMSVRWPEAQPLVAGLHGRYKATGDAAPIPLFLETSLDLFFPHRRNSAALAQSNGHYMAESLAHQRQAG